MTTQFVEETGRATYFVYWQGHTGRPGSNARYGGIRPLIKLPTGTKMSWNETNQNWDIDPNQLTGAITAQNYGDKVEYNDPAGVNDWKLFLEEEGSKYLISTNTIKNEFLNTDTRVIAEDSFVWAENRGNLISWMSDSSMWNLFKDNAVTKYAFGGPTINQLLASSNGLLCQNLTINDFSEEGVTLAHHLYCNNGDSWWYNILGSQDSIWCMRITPNGILQGASVVREGNAHTGIRPLVQLHSFVKFHWNGNSWDLST